MVSLGTQPANRKSGFGHSPPTGGRAQDLSRQPARPDLWGTGVGNDPGLPDRFGVPVASSAQENDRAALIARDTATGGAHWTTTTNGTRSASLGTWHGVTTDGDGRVTRLSLEDSNLTGAIPPALGTVTTLRNQEDLTDDGS